jgi:hypothetical protein
MNTHFVLAHAVPCTTTSTVTAVLFSHCTAELHTGVSSGGSSSGWSSDSRQLAVVAPSSGAGVSRDKPQWEEGVYHGGVITDETERLAAIATCHSVAINYILVSSHWCHKRAAILAARVCMLCSDDTSDYQQHEAQEISAVSSSSSCSQYCWVYFTSSPSGIVSSTSKQQYADSTRTHIIVSHTTLCTHVRSLATIN